jgi:hypothetical protein
LENWPALIKKAVIDWVNFHINGSLNLIMARALRIQFPGAFYYVTSRGNEQKAVFKSLGDREKFLSYLESATERYGAAVQLQSSKLQYSGWVFLFLN